MISIQVIVFMQFLQKRKQNADSFLMTYSINDADIKSSSSI